MVICLWVLMPFSLFVLFCCSKICLSYDCRVIFHLIKVVCIESGLFRLRFPINVNHHLTVMLAETRPFVNFSFFFEPKWGRLVAIFVLWMFDDLFIALVELSWDSFCSG